MFIWSLLIWCWKQLKILRGTNRCSRYWVYSWSMSSSKKMNQSSQPNLIFRKRKTLHFSELCILRNVPTFLGGMYWPSVSKQQCLWWCATVERWWKALRSKLLHWCNFFTDPPVGRFIEVGYIKFSERQSALDWWADEWLVGVKEKRWYNVNAETSSRAKSSPAESALALPGPALSMKMDISCSTGWGSCHCSCSALGLLRIDRRPWWSLTNASSDLSNARRWQCCLSHPATSGNGLPTLKALRFRSVHRQS